jgi:hypothetical protein
MSLRRHTVIKVNYQILKKLFIDFNKLKTELEKSNKNNVFNQSHLNHKLTWNGEFITSNKINKIMVLK